ncbi:MAG: CoA ester lyase [Armatimonadota bacterium]|nr:CoA ester lyase [Armatimonadota bacterium]MDR7450352.1 CoA ester lyase [Armatimonadota bacterium]MDR7467065.1 CoA ester lyase [Armatimonadota bacterium]MDR7493393.1 CoA ester lyase [Armatimonadota bacterium]MDR7499401.1 CoA ester lyase [Armatimonadota bacterium]
MTGTATGPIRLLRSMLFVPGDQPRMIEKARGLAADAIILDLEDGVAAQHKARARTEIRAALDGGMPEALSVWLRPNALTTGLLEEDLLTCLRPGLAGVVLPKIRHADEVALVDGLLSRLERARGIPHGSLALALLIETPQAVLHAEQIAGASSRVEALLFGADDLAAEMGVSRTPSSEEVRLPRADVALVAHAAGCEAVDIVYTAVRDPEGLLRECREGRILGYTGKQVIHPAQIEPVHAVFSPSEEEVAKAARIVDAYRTASRGAVVVDGRMVDLPIVRQAQRVLARAGQIARKAAPP